MFERPQQQAGAPVQNEQSRDLAERLEEGNADVAILWASQSGTAERMAGRLAKELSRHLGAKVLLLDLSDVEPYSCTKISQSKLVILLASTFGEGDPSDNMHEFWEWLKKPSSGPVAANLRYLAFGLGNSNYKHYNAVIDFVADQLDARGAKALMPVGRADDAAGETEEHFLEWKEAVFKLFTTELGYIHQEVAYEPSLQIVEDTSLEPIDLHHGIPRSQAATKRSSPDSKVYVLPIVESHELFADTGDRNCIHMELDLSNCPDLKYKTGDHLGVWPINPTSEVERLVKALGVSETRATPCHIKSLDETTVKVPTPTTIDALFEHYLEICAPVSREHVGSLAAFAPTESAKTLLSQLGQNKEAYAQHVLKNHVTLSRLLEAACGEPGAWKDLPLSFVVEMLPAMQPRYYSISSSAVIQARKAAITAVVADTTISATGDRIPGLATNYLLAQKEAAKQQPHPRGMTYSMSIQHQPLESGHLHAHVRKSTFKLPVMASTPVLMVGAGTGVAPFRAFVQERSRLKGMGREVGKTKLFFGCRNPEQDYIYQDEFAEAGERLGENFSMTTAFSRPSNGEQKRYVQDRVNEEAAEVCDLLVEGNAYFYICGSAAMAREVSDTVARIVMQRQGWSETQMKEFADRQKRQKRWLQDVWG